MGIWKQADINLTDIDHNFITECFFLTLAFMHYGPIRAIVNYGEFIREFGEIKKQAERAQQEAIRTANVRVYNVIYSTKLSISL